MAIHYTAEYQAPPQRVLGVLTDRDFLRDCATALRVLSHEAEAQERAGVWSTRLRLVAPTDAIPDIFRGLVDSEVVMDDRREWVADGGGGYRSTFHVDALIKGRPAAIRGSLTLRPSSGGTEFTAQGEVSFDVRFVGGLARTAIAKLCEASFEDETTVLRRWLETRVILPAKTAQVA